MARPWPMMFVATDWRDFVIDCGDYDTAWISLHVPPKLLEVASSLPGEAVGTGGLYEPPRPGIAPGVRARGFLAQRRYLHADEQPATRGN